MTLFIHNFQDPVYEFDMDCYKCGKKFKVYYPEEIAFEMYDIPTLKEVFSRTQNSKTIGNVCPHCYAYTGNYFVYDEFRDSVLAEANDDERVFERHAIYVHAFNDGEYHSLINEEL